MAFLLSTALLLAPLTFAAPSPAQLGDITILAADNLISELVRLYEESTANIVAQPTIP